MVKEPTLVSQGDSNGEVMRIYQHFDIPGIDILYNAREYTTAKQAQSAVHQYGRKEMMSELYGVCGYDFATGRRRSALPCVCLISRGTVCVARRSVTIPPA